MTVGRAGQFTSLVYTRNIGAALILPTTPIACPESERGQEIWGFWGISIGRLTLGPRFA